jgi:3-deoxy-D-manno-octulosonic-acid transferase
MPYLLYSLLYGFGLVLGIPLLLLRCVRERGYGKTLVERFGRVRVNPAGERSIWIHAVSVGEVIAVRPLIARLKRAYPGTRIALSVTTPTGRRVAEERLQGVDDLFSCPFDLAIVVRHVMRRVSPRALLVVETEIWPNLLREAHRAGAVSLLVNGRISDRSFPRYRVIRSFLKRFLAEVDRFLMQSALYAGRIGELGAAPASIRVVGSLKFDADLDLDLDLDSGSGSGSDSQVTREERSRVTPEGRRVLIAGSTLDPEEGALLSIFERLRATWPELFLVLAPRHPARFDEVYALATARGLGVARRSRPEASPPDADVLVLDTLGELASLYAEAEVVFVGGSIATWGGHNIIEPAAKGKPVLFGPHMQNFAEIARLFLEADAAVQVQDAGELERALRDLLEHPSKREELSRRAREVVERNRGAADRTVASLRELLP